DKNSGIDTPSSDIENLRGVTTAAVDGFDMDRSFEEKGFGVDEPLSTKNRRLFSTYIFVQ
ncbi:unnamed protein product, partial [marine sediment metagenome]